MAIAKSERCGIGFHVLPAASNTAGASPPTRNTASGIGRDARGRAADEHFSPFQDRARHGSRPPAHPVLCRVLADDREPSCVTNFRRDRDLPTGNGYGGRRRVRAQQRLFAQAWVSAADHR